MLKIRELERRVEALEIENIEQGKRIESLNELLIAFNASLTALSNQIRKNTEEEVREPKGLTQMQMMDEWLNGEEGKG